MLEASLKSKSTQVGSRYWALLWLGKHDGDINSPVWDLCSLVHLGSSLWVRTREAGGSVVSVPRVTPSLDEGRKPTGQWVELDHDAVPAKRASIRHGQRAGALAVETLSELSEIGAWRPGFPAPAVTSHQGQAILKGAGTVPKEHSAVSHK